MKSNSAFTLWAGPETATGADLFPPDIDYTMPVGMKITDNQVFVSARQIHHQAWQPHNGKWYFESSSPLLAYDDAYGPLWLLMDSNGLGGIVRCPAEHTAWEICEDEFYPEADETVEELKAEYNVKCEHIKMVKDAWGKTWPATEHDYPLLTEGEYAEQQALRGSHQGDAGWSRWQELARRVSFHSWETVETPAADDEDVWTENALFQDAYGFRPSGPNVRDKMGHGIYSKDLNGERLVRISNATVEDYNLTLTVCNGSDFYPMGMWSDTLGDKYQIN